MTTLSAFLNQPDIAAGSNPAHGDLRPRRVRRWPDFGISFRLSRCLWLPANGWRFTIHSLIGKGGMGEVYRARDTRLDREVAIKVSAERFTERFDREARVVASLNHPNICALYDVGPN